MTQRTEAQLSDSEPRQRASDGLRARSLAAILSPDTNCVHIRRSLPPAWATDFARLVAGSPFELSVSIDACDPHVERVLSELPAELGCAHLACELRTLVPRFSALTDQRDLKLKIAVIDTNACQKFHADWLRLRLIVTYTGPGTEYVPDAGVARQHLGQPMPLEEANAAIVPDPGLVRRAQPGDVILLKGEAWPGNAGRGAVHRSPPIQGTGARRLVLQLDVGEGAC
jgi:hypothetical protein